MKVKIKTLFEKFSKKNNKLLLKRIVEEKSKSVALRASILAVPYLGSTIDFLIFGKANELKLKRLKSFINDLKNDLEKVSEQSINKDYLISEEFSFICEDVIRRVIREYNKSKINLYKKFLEKSILKIPCEYEYRDYLQTLTLLTAKQLIILRYINKRVWAYSLVGRLKEDGVKMKYQDVAGTLSSLFGLGLLEQTIESDSSSEGRMPDIEDTEDKNIDIDIDIENTVYYSLNDYGRSFREFIELEGQKNET